MKPSRFLPLLLVAGVSVAQAHPGHGPADLASGFVHPFTGWDHLLAMVGVGLWAAQLGGRARWLLPCSFVAAMALGATAGLAGFVPPGVEAGILGSVLVLGVLLAGAVRLGPASAGSMVALAGLFHGMAHGAEMPLQADSLRFLAGMVAATAILHAVGLGAGVLAGRRHASLLRWAGAGIMAGGAALLLA